MKTVGAALSDHVDGRARVAALLGAEQVGLHLELLDRLDGGANGNQGVAAEVIVDAVEQVVIRHLAVAVNHQLGTAARVVGARAAADRALRSVAGADRTVGKDS